MQKVLRQENEKIVQLKGMTPDNRLPRDLLFNTKINSPQDKYQAARNADIKNEMRPRFVNKGLKK